jgi:alkylglycerol monooxygenase
MTNMGDDKLVLYAIPVFLAFVALEALWLKRRGHAYDGRDAWASLTMGVGNVIIAVIVKLGWFALFLWLYEYRLFDADPRLVWVWIGGIVLQDFCFYWYHRFSHRVRLFWAAHVNHHSSQAFNFTTALRQSWTTPLYSSAFFIPLPLLGFHPVMVYTLQSISLIYQFFLHTETVGRLGPLEAVMNTPSHHRVHHGRNPEYIDRNYGGILIVWDRLFGTFEPERAKVDYGLTHNVGSYNPLIIAFHYFAQMAREIRERPGWTRARRVLFGPPEWTPDADAPREPPPNAAPAR